MVSSRLSVEPDTRGTIISLSFLEQESRCGVIQKSAPLRHGTDPTTHARCDSQQPVDGLVDDHGDSVKGTSGAET